MNILPVVFHDLTSISNQLGSIAVPCLERDFKKICLGKKKDDDEDSEPENIQVEQNFENSKKPFRIFNYYFHLSILVVSLILWMFYSRKRKMQTGREGPFFTILFILSLTVSFRILFSIVALSISALIGESHSYYSTKELLLQSSLYVDYCSNFFSLSITFFMSLNRCLCFVAKDWNSMIFDGLHLILPVVFSVLISISGAMTCIITSEIKRTFIERLGFVDVGPNKGFRVLINRTFFLFPIGSILCYIALYYHIRQRARMVLTKTNQSQGEQKVFVQLLVTTVLYVTLHVIYEVLTIVNWDGDISFQLLFICTLGIFNCLPEMSLPLMLICNNFHIKKKFTTWVSSTKNGKESTKVVTAKPSTTAHTDH